MSLSVLQEFDGGLLFMILILIRSRKVKLRGHFISMSTMAGFDRHVAVQIPKL